MNLTLYLMRHGETIQETPWRFLGQRELTLSDKGRAQASWWREEFSGLEFAAAWCSDLERCVDTARIILGGRAIEAVPMPELREISLGEWDGLGVEEVVRRYPGQYEARGADIAGFRPSGGESFADLAERTWTALEAILRSFRPTDRANALVVAHAGVNRTLLCRLLGMPLGQLFTLGQAPCCLNIVAFGGGRPILKLLNRLPVLTGV